ncbi:glycosyltransferase family 39 protein [Quadrisphaera sp. INWT6]|uniref:glycosyltransferase family 39 protein n=1 Tax=Quadrisphaera sp. INWT6 TaxID=2596917 RepID=UPI0018926498|nr:glycosyltransferase family 39 protein [Quadrisphaera sp. INWT6]MBF5080295.1 hypothetical protein [Quadrisphaera sp. INWT6]
MSTALDDRTLAPGERPGAPAGGARAGAPAGGLPALRRRTRRTWDGVEGFAARHRLAVVAGVQLACAAAVLLLSRLYFAGLSMRLDEAQSLGQTDHRYSEVLVTVAQDVHVPGYHLLLRTWRLLYGTDLETARALSLIFFLASIPLLYLVARRALDTRWSLFAVVVFSLSPFMNWYGNEARMYTMLVLVTLASQHFFLKVLDPATTGRWGAWAGYAATAVVGAYTHYFFLFVLFAQGAFFLVARLAPSGRSWRGVGRMAGTAALVCLALVPWLLYFTASGAASDTRPQLPSPSSVDFSNVYSQFLFGFQSDAANTVLVATWPLLALAGLASVRVGVRMSRATAYLLVAAFGPVLMAFAVSHLITPFFLSRYMIAALPALLVVVAAFLRMLSKRVGVALAAVLLVATVVGTGVQATSAATPVKEDYRGAAELLEAKVTPSDLVVVSSPFTIWPFERYYDGAARVVTLPEWDRRQEGGLPAFDEAALPGQVDELVAGHQRVYLLLSYDQGYEDAVEQYFRGHYQQVYAQEVSPGMQLVGFRTGYSQNSAVEDQQRTAPRR